MLSTPLAPEHAARLLVRAMRVANCGTGAGGFQPGNTCGAGGGWSGGESTTKAELDQAFPRASKEVDGREVLKDVPNTGSIESSLDDYEVLPGIREVRVADFENSGAPKFHSSTEEARTKALAEKIRVSNTISPLIVVIDKQKSPYILEGGHRFDALKIVGAKSFPALVVVDTSEVEIRDLSLRTARRADETPLHHAATKFERRLMVSVQYAFARGRQVINKDLLRKAIASRDNVGTLVMPAANAVARALADTMAPTLAEVLRAGGEVAAKKIAFRAAELRDLNCGTGEGGFQPGNTCAKGDGEEFFHGTSRARLDSILKDGLLVSRAGESYSQSKKQVYLAKTEKEARFWANTQVNKEQVIGQPIKDYAILKVRIPTSELSRLTPDRAAGSDDAVKFKGNIKPEWIVGHKTGWAGLGPKPKDLEDAVTVFVVVILDEELRTAKGPDRVKLRFAFDATDQRAVDWADQHAAELVTRISETTREDINNAIAELLESGDWDDAYDTLLGAVGDDARARLIARHETMAAVSEGQRQAWDQAVDGGLLTGDEKRTWIVTPDDKLCPICEGLDGKTASMGGSYVGDDGEEYDGPPAHVQCRCTEGIA